MAITKEGLYDHTPQPKSLTFGARPPKAETRRIKVTGEGGNNGFEPKRWLGCTVNDGVDGRSRTLTGPEVEDAVLISEDAQVDA